MADWAITADHWHSDGCAGAEKGQFEFWICVGHFFATLSQVIHTPTPTRHCKMLSVLKIKNLALVDDLTWELGDGLIGVTGQTGAGKSMIVGALKLILGERANHDLIRTGESSCTVEAIFQLNSNLAQVNELLEETGLEPCEEDQLVLKRVFGSGNKQFVNCSPCTLSVLKALGNHLVDLHGPHEHQSLLSQDRQLAMLDAYAKAGKQRQAYLDAYRAWQGKVNEIEEFRSLRQATDQEIDLLRFQVDEIAAAALEVSQISAMEQRYSIAQNGAKLVDHAQDAQKAVNSAVANLTEAQRSLSDLEKLDPETGKFLEGFSSARMEIEELDSSLKDYTETLEIDPAELVQMEHRIDEIEGLKRKYGQSIEDVLEYESNARTRLESIDGREEELERLAEEEQAALEAVKESGAALGKLREKAAPKLAKEIAGHLEDLGFKQSVFEIEIEQTEEPQPKGFQTVDFLFGPNPGEPVKPLRVIASSGEMSRVMLAVKSALADQDQIPLMVFDEIDANVGGEIAGAVGKKMAALGTRHQVVAITHMPQVAALAHFHYLVTKEVENKTTHSRLEEVDGKTRLEELARMLGGGGDEAIALAEKLLSGK